VVVVVVVVCCLCACLIACIADPFHLKLCSFPQGSLILSFSSEDSRRMCVHEGCASAGGCAEDGGGAGTVPLPLAPLGIGCRRAGPGGDDGDEVDAQGVCTRGGVAWPSGDVDDEGAGVECVAGDARGGGSSFGKKGSSLFSRLMALRLTSPWTVA
jgi:hypothetical protein